MSSRLHRALPPHSDPHRADRPGWAFEIKHDGFRFICLRDGKRVRAFTRGGHNWSEQLPAITEALCGLPVRSATLDGEVVICAPDGRSDFDRMRAVFSRHGAPDAYAFDLLELDGRDQRGQPWDVRRAALVRLLRGSGAGIRLCEHIEAVDGTVVFRVAYSMGSKASSPSAATAATTRDARATGSRSRIRPTRPSRGRC